MTKEEIETYLKVQDEAWNLGRKVFEEKIRASNRQDFEGIEVGEDIFTVHWSEPSRGEWEDFYEHFPTELLLLGEDECLRRIDEIRAERKPRRREETERNKRLHEKLKRDEDLATMRALAAKYGYSVEEK